MIRSYTPSSDLASATLDQIAGWIGQQPERVACFAFIGARMMERNRLPYRLVFDGIVRAAMDAGQTEAAARHQTYKGFAFAAAGYIEPPPELSEGDD